MSRLYHPIVRCEVKHTMVRTDQTQREGALEPRCPPSCVCPVGAYFTEVGDAYRRPMAWDRSGGTCV